MTKRNTKYKRTPYKQGIYTPTNSNKYVGKYPIIYRSGLELSFFRWCDRNTSVLEWTSESIIIPYKSPSDGKLHRYFPDGTVVLKTKEGNKKFLIEVKPYKQTIPPKAHGNKKRSTILYEKYQWALNNSKWNQAKQWCKKHNYEFVTLTEKDLK